MSKAKQAKNWRNVYTMRQEYNRGLKKWLPVIIYWNARVDGSKSWPEAVCTDTGNGWYHTEIEDYTKVTRHGTGKCDPSDVKAIRSFFLNESEGEGYTQVERLGSYRP